MNFINLRIITVLLLSTATIAQNLNKEFTLSIGENFRLYPSNVYQWEVSIVNHPFNPNIMFASANALTLNPFFISEGIYVTTDGGNSWRGTDTCNGQPVISHYGDPGIAISKNGTFILTRKGTTPGIFSHYSTNNGLTWSNQKIISIGGLTAPEKASLVSDINSSSNYYGRTYATWVKLEPPYPVLISYSNDDSTWSIAQQINNPVQRSGNSEIAIKPNGNLYVCWATITNSSPFKEDYVGFATSSNGGMNWSVMENAFDMNGVATLLEEKGYIRINGLPRLAIDTSGGERNGWIYIVSGQENLAPAGSDPDIILNRSTDGGQTWSQGIRVNQDPLNNGKYQLFPAIYIDEFGGVNIIFYDDRNTTIDSLGVYLARSDDGGDSWREFEISDHNFRPVPIGGFQGKMGDNIGITSAEGKLWPVWMDNRTGIYQIWSVPIEISSVNVENTLTMHSEFRLEQNYPNPFNPSTTIRYSIENEAKVQLIVYDILGNNIATLVNEIKPAGLYEVDFVADKLPGGIYFYKLVADQFSETKKLILLK